MTDSFDHLKLCKEDADILDQLVEVGFEINQLEGLTHEQEQRARNILVTLGFLQAYPVEDASDALVDATLARIDQYESHREARLQVVTPELETAGSGFRIRMPDFVSIAAMVLIAISVFAMVSKNSRDQSMSNQCASNMAMVGHGLAEYAFDHNGEMPTTDAPAVASVFGGLIPQRTNPNKLVADGYCSEHHISCPACGDGEGSFSYQTQSAEKWDAIRNRGKVIIIMSDRNPILEKMLQGQKFNPLALSENHGSLGQNQLRDDGSTLPLMGLPIVGQDRIWILDGDNRGIDIFLTH